MNSADSSHRRARAVFLDHADSAVCALSRGPAMNFDLMAGNLQSIDVTKPFVRRNLTRI